MANEDDRDPVDEASGAASNGSGGAETLVSTLKSKELLIPAALSAAGAVMAAKGPDLFRRLTEATEQKGKDEAKQMGEQAVEGAKKGLSSGSGGLAGKALSKVLPGGGGGGKGKSKKTRRLPIQRWTDVAVPVDQAYEEWTKFDKYPDFMHRVLSVNKEGDKKVQWQEKIWFSKRQWVGEITDRRKNDRIAWKTISGTSHTGIVSFHSLADNLTRVMVTVDFQPTGMLEKMASGMRFAKRAVQADLARFKAHVELQDAKGVDYSPTGGDEKKDEKKDDKKDEKGDKDRQRGQASNDGGGDDDSGDDEEREADRDEREDRRRQRRETMEKAEAK